MTAFGKLVSDFRDIRTAVNAAREYSRLASLSRESAQRHDGLKAFLPN